MTCKNASSGHLLIESQRLERLVVFCISFFLVILLTLFSLIAQSFLPSRCIQVMRRSICPTKVCSYYTAGCKVSCKLNGFSLNSGSKLIYTSLNRYILLSLCLNKFLCSCNDDLEQTDFFTSFPPSSVDCLLLSFNETCTHLFNKNVLYLFKKEVSGNSF